MLHFKHHHCAGGHISLPYGQIHTHTQTHAHPQTEAALLNGAAATEIRTRLHYEGKKKKKLADFIKDRSVNKRAGYPD